MESVVVVYDAQAPGVQQDEGLVHAVYFNSLHGRPRSTAVLYGHYTVGGNNDIIPAKNEPPVSFRSYTD